MYYPVTGLDKHRISLFIFHFGAYGLQIHASQLRTEISPLRLESTAWTMSTTGLGPSLVMDRAGKGMELRAAHKDCDES